MRLVYFFKTTLFLLAVVLFSNKAYAASKNSKVHLEKKSSKNIEKKSTDSESNDSEGTDNSNIDSKTGESLSNEELLRKIEVGNALYRAQLEQELAREFAEARLEIERLKLERERMMLKYEIENEEYRKKHFEEVRLLKDQKELIQAEIELSQARMAKDVEAFNSENLIYQQAFSKMKMEIDLIKSTLDQKAVKAELRKFADISVNDLYFDQPLQKDGSLVISDRRIDLNGVITPWKANYVVDSIQYFNNKGSRYPIFIVIENSPGGCVLSGSRILEAMHKSKAPVYVVLKGFAASMAAIITTLAKKSFAYPNAQILHHQPSTVSGYLNVREVKELGRWLEKCNQRFLGPVAKKMKISLEDLDKKFYENAVHGDWFEYADDAKKIHWIDEIVTDIREGGIEKMPDPQNYTFKKYLEHYYSSGFLSEEEASGDTIYLPKLEGESFYYIYNPDNKYKLK